MQRTHGAIYPLVCFLVNWGEQTGDDGTTNWGARIEPHALNAYPPSWTNIRHMELVSCACRRYHRPLEPSITFPSPPFPLFLLFYRNIFNSAARTGLDGWKVKYCTVYRRNKWLVAGVPGSAPLWSAYLRGSQREGGARYKANTGREQRGELS